MSAPRAGAFLVNLLLTPPSFLLHNGHPVLELHPELKHFPTSFSDVDRVRVRVRARTWGRARARTRSKVSRKGRIPPTLAYPDSVNCYVILALDSD